MKKKIKNLWVKALRSGKYKQGKGRLKTNDTFCCLGVLCDISGLTEWSEDDYFGYFGNLPNEVMSWAEMRTDNGFVGNFSLTSLNDNGKSFNEIADFIEENWKEL